MAGAGPPSVSVDVPDDRDAAGLGVMHLESWHQTCPSAEHGIDADWISEHIGHMTSPAAEAFRRRLFADQRADPTGTYYRLARHDGDVVGFVHASRGPRDARVGGDARPAGSAGPEDAVLEALYLLREHHGTGLADQMVVGALDWLDGQPVRLEVASYNARAISSYRRYGFRPTGEGGLFRDRVPILVLRRDRRER